MKEFHWRDKAKHLTVSFIITSIILFFTDKLTYALLAIFLLTMVKEIYDQLKENKNSVSEMVSDTIYNFIGLVVAYLIHYFYHDLL